MMNKPFYILFFLLFSITVFAQEKNETVPKKENKIQFKIFYSPAFCYRKNHSEYVGFDDSRTQGGAIYSYNSNQEIPSYGFEFGILSEIYLSKNIFITSGISFEQLGYQTNQINNVYVLYMTGGPYQYSTINNNMSVKYEYSFLSTPLMLGMQFKHNKFIFHCSLGYSLDYLIVSRRTYNNYNTIIDNYNGQEESLKKNPYCVSFMLSTGISYWLRKKTRLDIEPYYKYIFTQFGIAKETNNITNPQAYFDNYLYYGSPHLPNLYSIGLRFNFKF